MTEWGHCVRSDYPRYGTITRYKGVNFRSRLEARWARFFDALNWQWEYEPCRMGNWIPDFLIKTVFGDCFAEVKPFINFNQQVADRMYRAINKTRDWDDLGEQRLVPAHELLLLPGDLVRGEWIDWPAIGWLHEARAWGSMGWSNAILIEPEPGRYGFFHNEGSYRCRITGLYDGDGHLKPITSIDVGATWRAAMP